MKAVGIVPNESSSSIDFLTDVEIDPPAPRPRDLLVRVEAVSVNPLDLRMRHVKPPSDGCPRILGWDCAGVVVDVGPEVTLFKPGHHVFYAGAITRPGANSELHVVDERIVGRMPSSIGFPEAAALPLASITAWEALFDRMRITHGGNLDKTLLIIGAAGGVGSMAIQLARAVAQIRVVATASRPVSQAWCRSLGANLVIDHAYDLKSQLAAAGIKSADYILCLSDTSTYFPAMADLVSPQGHICALVECGSPLPMNELRNKSASFSWEGMFTRSLYATSDMLEQHRILSRVAGLVDAGEVRTTAQKTVGHLNAANLREAHALVETGRAVGKVVLKGYAHNG